MIGPNYVREVAADKLGKAAAVEWERTPNPALEDGVAPVALLDSGCPSCINMVYELVVAM